MLAERLIEELKKVPPKADVRMHESDGEPVLFVVSHTGNPEKVWLESEDDVDLRTELEARFKHAADTQMDELDFYMDLLEIGITIDEVREYMDDEQAEHMKEFCLEHGLI